MARHKNANWNLAPLTEQRNAPTDNTVIFALLMDLRDELQEMNRKLNVLNCPDFLHIPHTLTRIARNTTKRRHVRKQVK